MIPNFDENNNLPVGIHSATWQEICDRYGYTVYRRKLLEGLKQGLLDLKSVGCEIAYLDGSFVTSKERPEDFDVCYKDDDVFLDALWFHFPTLYEFGGKTQKGKYSGEFFPASAYAKERMNFLKFFQNDKYTDEKKGIIAINLLEL